MVDISKVIEAKSDQLNSADLSGRELVIKIRDVRYHPEKTEQPLEFFYHGDNGKPWRLSKAAARIVTYFWGTETDEYIDRYIKLFNDEDVTFGGQKTGGIRIKAMSNIKEKTKVRVPVARMRYKEYSIDVLTNVPEPTEANPKEPVDPYINWGKAVAAAIDKCQSFDDLNVLETAERGTIDLCRQDAPKIYERLNQRFSEKRQAIAKQDNTYEAQAE